MLRLLNIFTVASAPEDLVLDSAGESWIAFSWSQIPSGEDIIEQIILAIGGGAEWNFTLDGNATTVNVSNLMSATEYIFRIITVTSDGQRSPPSIAFIAHTIKDTGMQV